MAPSAKILAFAGSLRRDSWNKKLVKIAADGARRAGAEVTIVDLREFPLPVYDGDLEQSEGVPVNARELKKLFWAHQGLLIASPEYNSSISAVLKNCIDWVSRTTEANEASLSCFAGKIAALIAASPGALGGLRGLVHLRAILGNIQVLVLPDQQAIARAHEAFAPDGSLLDAKQQKSVEAIGEKLAGVLHKLAQR